jgi:RND family efflux transporter MFP subunit
MKHEKLNELRIDPTQKTRPARSLWMIFLAVAVVTGAALYFAVPRQSDSRRVASNGTTSAIADNGSEKSASKPAAASTRTAEQRSPAPASNSSKARSNSRDDVVLTVSGYIVAHERIELSPRFMGTVLWIGVKKGDIVTNGQVVVKLDDAEYRAHQKETEGRLAAARAALEKAQLQYERVKTLANASVESRQNEDDMRLNVAAAAASVKELEGSLDWINTYIDWCTIRSPINGVVLEKLVDPDELVTPQSFGGAHGPSTALISVADLKDLQVEIDLNEADVAKVEVGQKCRVSPEAYPDRTYEGYVVEKSPEANRQKGTLQVKVQIANADRYLTPELTAKVDFLQQTTPAVDGKAVTENDRRSDKP